MSLSKENHQHLLFRVIQLENGLTACLIADNSPLPPHEDELSEDEGSYEGSTSNGETDDTASTEGEEFAGDTDQKMVSVFVRLSSIWMKYVKFIKSDMKKRNYKFQRNK